MKRGFTSCRGGVAGSEEWLAPLCDLTRAVAGYAMGSTTQLTMVKDVINDDQRRERKTILLPRGDLTRLSEL